MEGVCAFHLWVTIGCVPALVTWSFAQQWDEINPKQDSDRAEKEGVAEDKESHEVLWIWISGKGNWLLQKKVLPLYKGSGSVS